MTDIVTWLLSAESCSNHEKEQICEAVQSYRDYMDRLQRLLDQLASEHRRQDWDLKL